MDETGHAFRSRLGTPWAPTGQPPVLRRASQRREVATVAALVAPLDGPARLDARHFPGRLHGEQVIVALRSFRRRIGRPLLVVWDRRNAHRAKPVHAFLAAHPADYQVAWLPTYAPELNPEEPRNGAVKQELLNAVPGSADQLRQLARRSFRRRGRRSALLRSFFDHVALSVT